MMSEKEESSYAQRKRRKAELEALSDDELREEIEKASPEMRRMALKMAVSWLRGIISAPKPLEAEGGKDASKIL